MLKFSEEKMDEAIENTAALKFMSDVAKSEKFKNKQQAELEKVMKRQVYTTALVRVKFPDGYVLQCTFGALEKVKAVYD